MAKSYKRKLHSCYKILKPAQQNYFSFMDRKVCIKNMQTCMRKKKYHTMMMVLSGKEGKGK